VYTALKLNIRRRSKKRLPARVKQALFHPAAATNEMWSVDFMSDSLWDGRTFRLLNIVDDYNREVLHIKADTLLPTVRLIRSLEYLREFKGLPNMIRVDNGPEFISQSWMPGARTTILPLSLFNLENSCRMLMWNAVMEISAESF
jgi:putative transposase